MLAVSITATILSSCTTSGQVPGALRLTSAAFISVNQLTDQLLADNNFMYDAVGNRYVKVPVDANGDGTPDSYTDGLGGNWFIVVDYNAAYDMVKNKQFYTTVQTGTTISIRLGITAYSNWRFTNVEPGSGKVATDFCAVSGTPIH